MSQVQLSWADRYAPRSLSEIIGPDAAVRRLQAMASARATPPHLLMIGRPGCGRAVAAKLLAAELGREWHQVNVPAFVRQSGGISYLEQLIIGFANNARIYDTEYFVVLEEIESLEPKQQQVIAGLIKNASYTTFVFITNDARKVSPVLKTLCLELDFNDGDRNERSQLCQKLAGQLEGIVCREGHSLPAHEIAKIVNRHFPDIRRIFVEVEWAARGSKSVPIAPTGAAAA